MNRRQALAKSAAVQALRIRASLHVKPWDAIDIFDLTQQLGIELLFAKIASMEGMYLRQSAPTILIASERPAGRQRFSCAHELGHHVFGDGSRVDELFDPNSQKERDDEEVRADMFAGMLLMPKSTVDRAFSSRKLNPETADPVEFSPIANALGVGIRRWRGISTMRSALLLRIGSPLSSDVHQRRFEKRSSAKPDPRSSFLLMSNRQEGRWMRQKGTFFCFLQQAPRRVPAANFGQI